MPPDARVGRPDEARSGSPEGGGGRGKVWSEARTRDVCLAGGRLSSPVACTMHSRMPLSCLLRASWIPTPMRSGLAGDSCHVQSACPGLGEGSRAHRTRLPPSRRRTWWRLRCGDVDVLEVVRESRDEGKEGQDERWTQIDDLWNHSFTWPTLKVLSVPRPTWLALPPRASTGRFSLSPRRLLVRAGDRHLQRQSAFNSRAGLIFRSGDGRGSAEVVCHVIHLSPHSNPFLPKGQQRRQVRLELQVRRRRCSID